MSAAVVRWSRGQVTSKIEQCWPEVLVGFRDVSIKFIDLRFDLFDLRAEVLTLDSILVRGDDVAHKLVMDIVNELPRKLLMDNDRLMKSSEVDKKSDLDQNDDRGMTQAAELTSEQIHRFQDIGVFDIESRQAHIPQS